MDPISALNPYDEEAPHSSPVPGDVLLANGNESDSSREDLEVLSEHDPPQPRILSERVIIRDDISEIARRFQRMMSEPPKANWYVGVNNDAFDASWWPSREEKVYEELACLVAPEELYERAELCAEEVEHQSFIADVPTKDVPYAENVQYDEVTWCRQPHPWKDRFIQVAEKLYPRERGELLTCLMTFNYAMGTFFLVCWPIGLVVDLTVDKVEPPNVNTSVFRILDHVDHVRAATLQFALHFYFINTVFWVGMQILRFDFAYYLFGAPRAHYNGINNPVPMALVAQSGKPSVSWWSRVFGSSPQTPVQSAGAQLDSLTPPEIICVQVRRASVSSDSYSTQSGRVVLNALLGFAVVSAYATAIYAMMSVYIAVVEEIVSWLSYVFRWLRSAISDERALRRRRRQFDEGVPIVLEVQSGQLVCQSGVTDTEVLVDVIGISERLVSSFQEQITSLRGTQFDELREPLVAYLLSAISIARDPSVITVGLEVAKLANSITSLQGMKFHRIADKLKSDLRFVPQTSSTSFVSASIYTDPLAKAAFDIVSTISVTGVAKHLGILSPAMHLMMLTHLRSLMTDTSLDTFLSKIFSFMQILVDRLYKCVQEKSFAPLLQPRMTFKQWKDISHTAVYDPCIRVTAAASYFEGEKAKGNVPSYFSRQITEHERCDLMQSMWEMGEPFTWAGCGGVQHAEVMGAQYEAKEMRSKLISARIALEASLANGAQRPVPLGMYLFGPAGTGKSYILDSFAQVVADDMKVTDRSEVRYDSTKTKHMDGVTASKVFLVLDDPDQNQVASPTFSDTTWCQLVIGAINNTPFMAPMADVDSKGNIWLRPRLVVMTTNTTPSPARIVALGAKPSAVLRRFSFYIRLSITDAKERTATGTLKEDVVVNDATWTHEVFRINPSKNVDNPSDMKPTLTSVKTFKSRVAFLQWVVHQYTVYQAKALKAHAAMLAINQDARCTHCGLRSSWHLGDAVGPKCKALKIEPEVKPKTAPPPVPPRPKLARIKEGEEGFEEKVDEPTPIILEVQAGAEEVPEDLRAPTEFPPVEDEIDPVKGPVVVVRSAVAIWALGMLVQLLEGRFHLVALQLFCVSIVLAVSLNPGMAEQVILYGLGGSRLVAVVMLVRKVAGKNAASSERTIRVAEKVSQLASATWLKWLSAALAVMVPILWMYLRRMQKCLAVSPQSSFVPLGTGDVKKVPVVPSNSFVKVPKLISSYPAKGTEGMTGEQMVRVVCSNMARVTDAKGNVSFAMYIGGGKWLVNKHMVASSPTPRVETRCMPVGVLKDFITFEHFKVSTSVHLTPRNTATSVLRDLAVVCAPSVVSRGDGLLKFIPASSMASLMRHDNGTLILPNTEGDPFAFKCSRPEYLVLTHTSPDVPSTTLKAVKYDIPTKPGYCGCPLVVRGQGGNFIIIALHAWGNADQTPGGLGEELVRTEIMELSKLATAPGTPLEYQMKVMGGALDDPRKVGLMSEFELKDAPENDSSAVQAWRISQNFHILGTLPKAQGQKLKSKFLPSPMYASIVEIAKEEGVEISVTRPTFKGEMGPVEVDGTQYTVWKNAYTQSLLGMRNIEGPEKPLEWAVNDYYETVKFPLAELLKDVVPLDWESVFRGDDAKLFNPKDLDTSTGPPWNCQKRKHIEFHDEETLVSELYMREVLDLEQVFITEKETVVCPVFRASLKDEPISVEKANEHKERVFYCCNDSYNSLLKRYVGPILMLLSRLDESEMSLGMNICSIELDAEQEKRSQYDPRRERECAADFRWYDKRQSSQILRYAFALVRIMVDLTAYSDLEKDIVTRLLFGLLYSVIICKSEVLVFGFSLFSGSWVTALINSLVNSILERAAFYIGNTKMLEDDLSLRFRMYVYLKVMGDDNRSNATLGCNWDHFVLRDGVAQYGMELTSANKGAALERYATPEDSSYLKRTFYYDSESMRWKAPLALASIFKMLCFYRPPKYGVVEDQIAANIYNACAELYMHGRDVYDRIVPKLMSAADEETRRSPFLRRVSYELFDDRFRCGANLWIVENDPIYTPLQVQMMSGGDSSTPGETTMSMGLTPMDTDATTVVESPDAPPLSSTAPIVGNMISDEPSAILKRAVRILNISVGNTNTARQEINNFLPISLMMNTSQIASKTRGFYTWRGTVDLTFQITVPGTGFGLYYASLEVDPTAGDGNAVLDTIPMKYPQAFQAKHGTWLNMEQGGIAKMRVPWFYLWDRAPVNTAEPTFPRHLVRVWCVNPVRSSLDNSAAITGTISVFASLGDDFRLYSIVPQSGTISSVLKTGAAVAGALSAVPVLAPYAMPLSVGLAGASSVASALGHTRHREAAPVKHSALRAHQPIGPSDGVDSSVPNSLTSQSLVSDDPRIAGGSDGDDEMSFAYIFSRPGLVATYPWATSAAPGQILASIPVTPGLVNLDPDGLWYPTPSAFVGAPCAFWRGSMKYQMKVSHPPMSSGVYVVFWTPSFQTGVIGYDPTVSAQACVIDLGPSTERVFTVGWCHFRNVLNMRLGHVSSTFILDEVNGYLNIAVVTPLSTAAATAPSVQITVLQSCGMDMAIGGARPYANRSFKGATNGYATEELLVVAQTSLAQQPVTEVACVLTTNGEAAAEVVSMHYGEPVLSCKALCQKFGYVNGFVCANDATNGYYRMTISQPCYPYPWASLTSVFNGGVPYRYTSYERATSVWTTDNAAPCFTWLGYLRTAYAGIRGGTLLKTVMHTEANQKTIAVSAETYEGPLRNFVSSTTSGAPRPFYTNQTWGPTVHMQSDTMTTGEFYLPYNSGRLFWPACGVPNTSNDVDRMMQVNISSYMLNVENNTAMEMWVAGASDFTLLYWRFAPALVAPAAGALLMEETPPELGGHQDVKNEIVPQLPIDEDEIDTPFEVGLSDTL